MVRCVLLGFKVQFVWAFGLLYLKVFVRAWLRFFVVLLGLGGRGRGA